MATEHITQKQAKELPELPELGALLRKGWYDEEKDEYFVCLTRSDASDLATEIEPAIYAYGQQCAAHARQKALEEVRNFIQKLDEMVVSLKPYEIVNAIQALKKAVK